MWNIFLAIATGTCKFLTFYSPFTRVKATSKLNKKWVLQGLLLTMFPYIPLIPCSLSDPRMFLLNANFSTCKLIIVKIHKKDIPFFHWEGFFFLKTSFHFGFNDSCLSFFFSNIQCCFVYLLFQWTCLWCISALKEEKNMNKLYFLFPLFCSF